jgi:hypothetical protein
MSTSDPTSDNHCFCSTLDDAGVQPNGTTGTKARAALLNAAFWGKGKNLCISFMGGEPDLQRRVAALAQAWPETGADFSFEFWIGNGRDPAEGDIRITFEPEIGSFPSSASSHRMPTVRSAR